MNEKLTAYVLNELPPDECAELEAQMKNDTALRTQAEEMKAFCAMLSAEAADDDAALTTEQRGSVMRAFTSEPATKRTVRPLWRHPAFLVPTALAACVALMLVVNSKHATSRTAALEELAELRGNESQLSEQIRVVAEKRKERRDNAPVPPSKPAMPELLTAKNESVAFPPPQIPASILLSVEKKPMEGATLDLNSGTVALGGTISPDQPGVKMQPLSGTISGAGAVTESGSGTLTLNGSNTYSGGTTVNAGTLVVGSGGALVGKDASSTTATNGTPMMASTGLNSTTNSLNFGNNTTTTPPSNPEPQMTLGRGTVAMGQKATPAAPAAAAPMPAKPITTRNEGAAVWFGTTTATSPAGPPPVVIMDQSQLVADKDITKLGDATADAHGDQAGRAKRRDPSGESYTRIYENPFLFVAQQPLSTFSIDVDTASYANVRRFLNEGQRPPADAVRLEELINYFPYNYEGPSDGKPFGVMVDVAEAPWQPMHRLVRVALKGHEVQEERGAANFVFLVDVSGSMDSPDKLPLVQRSLEMLVRQLGEKDRVALVVYAGNSGLVLPSTPGSEKETILQAVDNLKAGGSTNGAGGIKLAYEQAAKNFIKGGVNRVILCTDGDFNVGISSPEQLEKLIAEKAKSRVFLSVLGFGTGNLKDRTMETLADKGNGNYAYIDSLSEARKVLVDQMNGTLVTIAKDVKIQVEFNPAQVAAYRLLGYENRILAKEDFNNDKKDAGEIGAGHTVTALYEIVPANVKYPNGQPLVDELKYAAKPALPVPAAEPKADAPASNEILTVKLRYKQPEGDKSDLMTVPVTDKEKKLADSPRDFQFAASVAGFGMMLRGSQHAGELTWDMVRDLALRGKGEDALGYRGEFLQLIDKARGLTEQRQ